MTDFGLGDWVECVHVPHNNRFGLVLGGLYCVALLQFGLKKQKKVPGIRVMNDPLPENLCWPAHNFRLVYKTKETFASSLLDRALGPPIEDDVSPFPENVKKDVDNDINDK